LALVKFVLLAVISAVSLYFIITSIQNFIQLQSEVENAQRELKAVQREVKAAQQALKNYEQSTKQVDLAKKDNLNMK
jgi:uncharacterized membrane protein (DUF106 family)